MTPDELALVATLKARRNQARASGCVTVYIYCVYAICRITDSVRRRSKTFGG
jgi:hypothetical protein